MEPTAQEGNISVDGGRSILDYMTFSNDRRIELYAQAGTCRSNITTIYLEGET